MVIRWPAWDRKEFLQRGDLTSLQKWRKLISKNLREKWDCNKIVVIGFYFHWLFIRLCLSSFPELLNHRAKRLWERSLSICKQNCVCSNVSCHHLQDLPTWFHPQDLFAPINSPIHVPNPYWSTAGNELHTCGPLRPYSTVTPHKYGLWCFKHILSIDMMHTNLEMCEITQGDLSYTNNQISFFWESW